MGGRKWEKSEGQFLKENYSKMMAAEIGKVLNRTSKAIYDMAQKLNITREKWYPEWDDDETKRLKLLIKQGLSNEEIAKKMKRNRHSIQSKLTCLRLYHGWNYSKDRKKARMPKLMNAVEKAWLAGVIDGEGSVGVDKSGIPCIRVYNTNREFIEVASKLMNSSVCRQENVGWADEIFTAQRGGQYAVNILGQILPYLIIKKEIAERIIQNA